MSNEIAIVPANGNKTPVRLNKTNEQLAIRQGKAYQADYVRHLGLDDVHCIGTITPKCCLLVCECRLPD